MRPIVRRLRRSLFVAFFPLLAPAGVSAQTSDRQDPVERLRGFDASELPQFVAVTFDDNFRVDGVEWANEFFSSLENPAGNGVANNYDGTPVRTTFFHNSTYLWWPGVPEAWAAGFADGHEIANHTENHLPGRDNGGFDEATWNDEIESCTQQFVGGGLGVTESDIVGFRTPFLAYNDATFASLAGLGFEYDSSLQGCWGVAEDGSNCLWPYTLDVRSPDNAALVSRFDEPSVTTYPGLWEVPVSALIVPPDSLAEEYGFAPGLRDRVPTDMTATNYYEPSTGKLAPMDITLFLDAALEPNEVLAILKYSFDLHYDGNRAPFVFVAHTHVYSPSYDGEGGGRVKGTAAERRAAIEDFVTYALAHGATRMRPVRDIVEWMRHPRSLSGAGPRPETGSGGSSGTGGGSASSGGGTMGPGGQGGSEQGGDDGDEGCSCRAAGGRPSSSWGWTAGAWGAALLLVRRVRRRA